MKIAASACASGVGFQENPIAAARMPAIASQSAVSCSMPSRLRAALSGVIVCDPSVEQWQREGYGVVALDKQRKMTHNGHRNAFAERAFGSLCLDIEGPDDVAPLLGFVGNEFSECGRCH